MPGYLVHGMGPVSDPITTAAEEDLAHLDHWVFGLDTRPFAPSPSPSACSSEEVLGATSAEHGSAGSRVGWNAQYARHGPGGGWCLQWLS